MYPSKVKPNLFLVLSDLAIMLIEIFANTSFIYLYAVGMGDNKNYMSQYIMRVIITIIDIITISFKLTVTIL